MSDLLESRFHALVQRLKQSPASRTRQEAHDLLIGHWRAVNQEFGLAPEVLRSMNDRRLCREHGWHNLGTTPCYWDSKTTPEIRIYLHDDGAIVIQRINDLLNAEILHFSPPASGLLAGDRPRVQPPSAPL